MSLLQKLIPEVISSQIYPANMSEIPKFAELWCWYIVGYLTTIYQLQQLCSVEKYEMIFAFGDFGGFRRK
jgi:hypothetical protein